MRKTLHIVITSLILLCTWGVSGVFAQSGTGRPFITKWQGEAGKELKIPIVGTYKMVIKDGSNNPVKEEKVTVTEGDTPYYTFIPNADGIYTVAAGPEGVKYMRMRANRDQWWWIPLTSNDKLLEVVQFGTVKWESMYGMFRACENMTFATEIDTPDLSKVTRMGGMFDNCSAFNQPLNNWNVSNVTDMEWMFSSCSAFNQPLNEWNVSKVTDMHGMFSGCSSFNQSLNNWNVSNVTDMGETFCNCSSFNQPLDNWNVSNVTNMGLMFMYSSSFNQPLNNWKVSNVTSMSSMFEDCSSFNQPLDNWDVNNVTNMESMFDRCRTFNQPLNNWNVSNVTDMWKMFHNCTAFNQPLNSWDVSKVTNMEEMFHNCSTFNQPLGNWDVSKVTNMEEMFHNCSTFNQPLDNWNVSNATKMNWMFEKCSAFDQSLGTWKIQTAVGGLGSTAMSIENYSKTLVGWANGTDVHNLTFGVSGRVYNAEAKVARQKLIKRGWEFYGDKELQTFGVTLAPAEHGKIAIDGHATETSITVEEGTTLTVAVTPDEGYKLKELKANDEDITNTKQFTVIAATEVKAVFEKQTFAVTSSVNNEAWGSIELTGASDLNAVEYGTELTVTVTKKEGYKLKSLTAGDKDITATQKFTVKAATEVKAVFEKQTFAVTTSVNDEEWGSIELSGASDLKAVEYGTKLTVTVTENEGYKLKELKAGDEDITDTKQFFVKTATIVTAKFEKLTFKLQENIVGTGSLNFTDADDQTLDPMAIPYGTTVKVVPVENDPWELVSLMAGTEDITTPQSFVLKSEVTVYAVFQDKNVPTFKVTVTQTEGGTIAIPGYTTAALEKVSKDTELTVTVTPDAEHGYKLKELKANEDDITTTKQFTVTAATEVKAVFELLTFQITPDVTGEGCSLTFKNAATDATITDLGAVPYGTTVKVVPMGNDPWELKELSANGKDIFATKEFTIKEATTVKAVFKKPLPKFTVTLAPAEHGKIAIDGHATETSITAEQGTTLTVTVTPKEGYKLKSLKAGEEDITNTKQFTVKAATEVKAVFEKETFAVTTSVNDEAWGSIALTGAPDLNAVEYGTELTVKVTPDEGYKLKSLKAGEEDITNTKQFTVKANTEVKAVFEKETFVVTTSVNDEKGGEIVISGASDLKAVAYGTELTVKVTEHKGYELKELKAGDADITATKKFIVKAATEVKAVFENKQGGAVEDALLAGIVVAPNPFSSQLRILNPEGVAARYEVVNASGVVVRSGALSGREEIVDTEMLPAGIYFVRLEAQNGAKKNVMVSK